jgi:predicted AlkP superfamily phosphohydrolase/phosphomutase
MKKRVLVIGLDGAPYGLVRDLMAAGTLPNMERLAKTGAFGELTSVVPFVSPAAWASFMTGKEPAEHGVYGFEKISVKKGRRDIFTSEDVGGDTLWRILSADGRKVIVINVPLTYPPEDVNGVIVADFLAPQLTVKPDALRAGFEEKGYVIDEKPFSDYGREEFLRNMYEKTDKRFEMARELMDANPDWEFLIVVFTESDRIQHCMWEPQDDGPESGGEIGRYYQHADKLVGRLVEKAGGPDAVFVISDHGFSRLDKIVHIDNWLVEEGYIEVEDNLANLLRGQAVSFLGFLKDHGVSAFIRRRLGPIMAGYGIGPPAIKLKYSGNSRVACSAHYTGQLWINPRLGADEYRKTRDELASKLKALRDPENGAAMIEAVHLGEGEAGKGGGPDITPIPSRGYWVVGGMNYPRLIEKSAPGGGRHDIRGVLILSGKDVVRAGAEIKARLIDIAPTVLKIFRIEAEMGGKPLPEFRT